MALSAAEKQRRYRQRIKNNPVKYQQYLKKDLDRYHRRKVPISELSEREKRAQRKRWKKSQRDYRSRKANFLASQNTPPTSPEYSTNPAPSTSRQLQRGRKKVRRDKAKCYKKLSALETKLQNQIRITNKYKKRLYRLKKTSKPSPRSKAESLLRKKQQSKTKKELTFHYALIDDIKRKYANTKSERKKRIFIKFLSGSIIKKYKMKYKLTECLGISPKSLSRRSIVRKAACRGAAKFKEKVIDFYCREDNARMTTGRKQTVTRKKCKKQKMFLSDS